jgi:ssDNA-binding Zn-finger/Zn-ribbon topoisomerase 1
MKAHIITKCKPCPFCGARADEIESITGLSMIACSNYNGCDAIVSFNNLLTIWFYVGGSAT